MIPVSKIHYLAIVIKTIWYCWKYKPTDQWKIKNPKIDMHVYQQNQLQDAKEIQWRKDTLFNKIFQKYQMPIIFTNISDHIQI